MTDWTDREEGKYARMNSGMLVSGSESFTAKGGGWLGVSYLISRTFLAISDH